MIRAMHNHRAARSDSQRGMTLVELLISVTLLGLITSALTASFITAIRAGDSNAARIKENNDAQVIAAFLTRDAQAAGGTNPITGVQDTTIGVSTSDAASCTSSGNTLVVRFKWLERLTGSTYNTRVANYFYNAVGTKLIRQTCLNGTAASPLTLAEHIGTAPAAPLAECLNAAGTAVACAPLPTAVRLTAYTTNASGNVNGGHKIDLRASTRAEGQTLPSGTTSSTVPLLLLASGNTCVGNGQASALAISATGSPDIFIYGTAVISGNSPSCPEVALQGNANLVANGGVAVLAPGTCSGLTCSSFTTPLPDPYAGLTAPGDCTGASGNPAQVNGHYVPGTYATNPNPGASAIFDPGIYIFCNGLTTSGTVTANNVLFYFHGGTLTVGNGSDDTISAATTGPYAGLAIWQRSGNNATMTVGNANGNRLTVNGAIYAPTAVLDFSNGIIAVTSIVAGAMQWGAGGTGNTTIGTVPANALSITAPTALPAATVNLAYPNTTVVATGGGGGYSFTATGLPAGVTMNASTGVISGTPTATGSFAVSILVTDGVSAPASRNYTLLVNAAPTITGPTNLSSWTITRDYAATPVTANGGTGPYTWSATGLAAGLTIDNITGIISGTPSAIGAFTVTATVTDARGATASRTFAAATINALPTVTGPNSLPTWTANQTYPNQTMTRSGGTAPFTWAASGLPAGLSINTSTGVISGTPTTPTTYAAIVVTMTDIAGASATRSYSVTINPPPVVGTTNLPDGELTVPYSRTLAPGSGGTPPYTWTASGLPAGLTISSAGVISGIPTVAGTFTVTVTLRDATNATTNRSYTFDIKPLPTITGPATLRSWTIGRDYGDTPMIASGGTTPYVWSAAGLPPGLTINAATGDITGTPTATGTYSVTISLVDALGVTATRPPYSVVVNPTPLVTTATIPNGEQTAPYSAPAMTVTAGTAPFTWSASGLPPGVTVNASTGALSGTPTAAGSYSVAITAVDAAGASNQKTFSVTIIPPPSITSPTTLPAWTVNIAYPLYTATSAGGTAPFTWSASGLPTGLSINSASGNITGTPTATGTFASATVTVTDALSVSATQNYSITINAAPAITGPATLPNWTQGQSYTRTLTSSGGTPLTSFTISGLPAGLILDSNTGAISGAPTAVGTFSGVTATLTDAAGAVATRVFPAFTINPAPSIITLSLPNGDAGTAYSSSVAGTGGTTPYAWTSTTLPAGLTLNAGTGAITGTPTAVGTTNVTFTLTDAAGATATNAIDIAVTTVPLTVTAMTVTNTNGQIATGDTLSFTYNKAIAVASMCSGGSNPWVGDTSNQSINGNNQVVVSINNNAGSTGNDTMTVTSTTCSLRFGTIDLGSPSWVTATRTFSGTGGGGGRSSVAYTASSFTISVTLGTASGATAAGIAAQTFAYTPNASVTDTFGTAITVAPPYSFGGKRF